MRIGVDEHTNGTAMHDYVVERRIGQAMDTVCDSSLQRDVIRTERQG